MSTNIASTRALQILAAALTAYKAKCAANEAEKAERERDAERLAYAFGTADGGALAVDLSMNTSLQQGAR